MSSSPTNKGNIAQILSKFKEYDTNGDGTLEEEELGKVLHSLNPEYFTEDRVSEMFYVMDGNFDGVVTIEEFLSWIWRDNDAEQLKDERRHVLDVGGQVSAAMEDLTELESCTVELERDYKIFDVVWAAYAADKAARDAVVVDVPKPAELQRSGTFMQVPLAEHRGGWDRIDIEVRKPAGELLQFLQRGGEVPAAYLGYRARNVVGQWKSRVVSLQGGYLVTEGEHGRPREAVYQIVRRTGGRYVLVHKLPALSHATPDVKHLAEDDGHGNCVIEINKAVPLLDALPPAQLAAQAMELSREIDELTELLVRQKPDNMTFSVEQFEAQIQHVRRKRINRPKTRELDRQVSEADIDQSEVEVAASLLQGELAKVKDMRDAPAEAAKICAAAEELLQLLLHGGPIPDNLERVLMSRRNLTTNWLKRVKRLRGGLLITEGRGGRHREVVYQILAVQDPRHVCIRRLKVSSASDVAHLAQDDGHGGLKIKLTDAVPLLDAVGPAPLAARATELAARLQQLQA